MGKLGRHLRNVAIRGCQRWPIFINLNPHEFEDPFLVQPDEPVFINERPVYLEISEGVPSDFFDQCQSVLSELRRKGVLLAIDDFGAGSSSLRTMVELEPDMVKIHRDLVIGCLPGSREFDLLRSITDLCHQMKAQVIAEGIETLDELKACVAAGIDYGQGFLLSVPHNPPPSFFWPPELPEELRILPQRVPERKSLAGRHPLSRHCHASEPEHLCPGARPCQCPHHHPPSGKTT